MAWMRPLQPFGAGRLNVRSAHFYGPSVPRRAVAKRPISRIADDKLGPEPLLTREDLALDFVGEAGPRRERTRR